MPQPTGPGHALIPEWTVVALVRYLEGTLRYDELVLAVLVRRGWRLGLWADRIWVNSLESLWGGRRIWGLPKVLAEFHWTNNQAQIADQEGPLAALTVNMSRSSLPAIWIPSPGFGHLPGNWTFTLASVWAHLGRSGLRIDEWSTRLPYQLVKRTPTLSFAAIPFRMTVPAPRLLADESG